MLLQFDFWIWGRAGFWLGWAVLGWAVFLFALEFDFGILGTAGGFCFLLLPFWLGWAGLPLGLAGLGSPHARFRENSKRMKMQYEGFGGFCFCSCNLIFGSGGGLVFGWAGLCWAGRFFFSLWNLILASWGRLAGFAFCFCRFGWAGLGCRWAWLGWALLTHVLGKIRNE